MESSKFMSTDKATVIIQVNPQVPQDAVICDDGQETRRAYHNSALTKFFRAQPKALGTVQIMIGVMVILFGIVRTIYCTERYRYDYGFYISVITGITYWGSLIVKASLIMNVISGLTAAAAIVLMGTEMYLLVNYNGYYELKRYDVGIVGILLVFSILQFIISICISGFACKATSDTNSTVVNVALNKVKGALIMNVISAITAAPAIIMMSIDMQFLARDCYNNYSDYDFTCLKLKRYDMGIIGVLLVFTILQFIISICISGFACKANNNTNSTVVNVALNKGN
ncbi:membrane-spanning 4-domains subfamily A member 4A-like protein [Labeo rohita]|uniref:Membrane-spanning 4-domains subfamily A member 4A-like protein n=1 Tax=Labeo rohita TaxID=84645 RepID=A0A498MEG2_LABRO|nr:membrane-spanning 4-domains subfamily A member 4A-like protein [Labeo rohita]